jgi:hypothetical protein
VLLLEVSSVLFLSQSPQLVQRAGVGIPHHLELHPFLIQVLREVSHELVDSGFPEELLRVLPVDAPSKREMDGSFLVVLMVKLHQLPKRQAPPGRLIPHVLPAEAPVREIQPGGLRHLAVGNLRHVV